MKNFKNFSFIIAILVCFQLFILPELAFAAKKPTEVDEKEIAKLEKKVDALVKKVYASSLFSPEDAEKLVEVKLNLDSIDDSSIKDPVYARLYFDVGYICNQREYTDEAIRYFKLVHEKFPETAFAKKSINELNKMGINLFDAKKEEKEQE